MDYKVNFKTKTMEWKTKYNGLVNKVQEIENKVNNKKMYIYIGTFTPTIQNAYPIHVDIISPLLIEKFSSISDIFRIFRFGCVGYSINRGIPVMMVSNAELTNLLITGESGDDRVSDFQEMSIEVYDTEGNYITILEI